MRHTSQRMIPFVVWMTLLPSSLSKQQLEQQQVHYLFSLQSQETQVKDVFDFWLSLQNTFEILKIFNKIKIAFSLFFFSLFHPRCSFSSLEQRLEADRRGRENRHSLYTLANYPYLCHASLFGIKECAVSAKKTEKKMKVSNPGGSDEMRKERRWNFFSWFTGMSYDSTSNDMTSLLVFGGTQVIQTDCFPSKSLTHACDTKVRWYSLKMFLTRVFNCYYILMIHQLSDPRQPESNLRMTPCSKQRERYGRGEGRRGGTQRNKRHGCHCQKWE